MVGGTEPSNAVLGNAERDSLYGVYRAFWKEQIPVDFVNAPTLTPADLRPYKIVFLPYPVMLSKQVADAVREYVAQGGTAVAEARLAWNNARGYASPVIPGFDLDKVFGAHETSIHPESQPRMFLDSAELPGLKSGDTIEGAAFQEDLQPLATASVLAKFPDGQPAISRTPSVAARPFLPVPSSAWRINRNRTPRQGNFSSRWPVLLASPRKFASPAQARRSWKFVSSSVKTSSSFSFSITRQALRAPRSHCACHGVCRVRAISSAMRN